MSGSATESRSGPSLEQILWRAMDRFAERPALVDADEFASRLEGVFAGELPAEAWVARFFEGEKKARPAPADMAEAIVRVTQRRLTEYQFDLDKLEYVILEEKEKVVVVSDFGQFALQSDDVVKRAIDAAVIPGEKGARGGTGARAYLVRASGEVVAVDVKKVARSLEQLLVRQVSAPAVQKPGSRLAQFGPVRRPLGEAGEARVLRQDPRTLQPVPAPPRTDTLAQRPALFLLLPDGSLTRAAVGSATRWQEMLGGYLRTLQQGSVGEHALTRALAAGARPAVDRFWVQPGADRPLGQGGAGPSPAAIVVQQVQLGEATFDPSAAWALATGAPALRAALDGSSAELAAPPALAQELRALAGSESRVPQVIAFRAPDGTLRTQDASRPVRLAASASGSLRAPAPLAFRSGALPATALAALQLAMERTASAGGYRLPTLRILSAPDAIEAGAAMDLSRSDPRRTSVRLAGVRDRGAGQVMELLLSMPFPAGEVHVGSDLDDALQAWLGAAVQPAPAAVALRVQDAPVPVVYPAGSPGLPGLPALLQHALLGGDWTLGSGAPLAIAVRDVALASPSVLGAPPAVVTAPPRPLHRGEEEIVIPLPLWAQMGRAQFLETSRVMASPLAPAGYAPPIGVYRLVAPQGGTIDFAAGAPAGSPEAVDLAGPTTLQFSSGAGGVTASWPRDRLLLGRIALDRGELLPRRLGSRAIDAPPAAPALVSGAQDANLSGALEVPSAAGFIARARAEGERSAADAASALAGLRSATRETRSSPDTWVAGLPPTTLHVQGGPGSFADQGSSWRLEAPWPAGAVDLSRPAYPSLPTALRFRYVGAPAWWPSSQLDSADDGHAAAAGAWSAGLRAASSAASLWRSVLVAGASPSAPEPAGGAAQAASGSSGAPGSPAYLAISRSGSAGALGKSAAARAMTGSIEMSIVAAIPPAPPPLETMGSLPGGGAPRARHTQQGQGGAAHGPQGDESDTVSESKIEGSVDAIAQRIYHRIRRRIQSDRERFGG